MKVLVTAGNTMTMIDDVRAISNIFRGKTGNKIAEQMCEAGHNVILLTSSPDLVLHRSVPDISTEGSLAVVAYKTYDDLLAKMEYAVRNNRFDLIVHSAAVSDYKVVGTYVPCEPNESPYVGPMHFVIKMLEKIGKISSSHKRLFLELVPTGKIIDKIRRDWGFKGYLVKFKLEVGITDGKLLDIARASRAQSNANLIVANCLEWASERAYVIGRDDVAHAVKREDIALAILRRMQ
jgi:phosphopantothenate--cysteine ligase